MAFRVLVAFFLRHRRADYHPHSGRLLWLQERVVDQSPDSHSFRCGDCLPCCIVVVVKTPRTTLIEWF